MNKKEWLIAAIFTFITACAWVVFSIFHSTAETKVSPQIEHLIEPINPIIDTKDIEKR